MNQEYIRRVLGLEGKKGIVTGGNSGIGRGAAVALASMGAEVTILGRDQPSIDETVAELRELEPKCAGVRVDIAVKEEIDGFFDAYYREHDNQLDILVANAGICFRHRSMETTAEDVDVLFDINYKGTLFCCQQAAKAMKEQKSGNIVIVTSVNALYPLPTQAAYTSTKCALEGLMQCMAVDLAPYGIRVNSLAPGAIRTNISRGNPFDPNTVPRPGNKMPREMPNLPLGRAGDPEDMGDVIACMVSDAFRYMTGSTVLVDGGLKLRNV